jgi:hypothetical protein
MANRRGWIGIDLDGTLAAGESGLRFGEIGAPVQPVVDLVQRLISEGWEVRIFTARASWGPAAVRGVEIWCRRVFGLVLPVTNCKDGDCLLYLDDRAVSVGPGGRIRSAAEQVALLQALGSQS